MKKLNNEQKQSDLGKEFYKVIAKIQDLGIYVENTANDLANNYNAKKYQVYFKSLDRLKVMTAEIETFTKELKVKVRAVK